MNLRPYQERAIADLHNWFHANREGNPVMVLPTGSGKSVVMAEFVRQAMCQWPGTRVLSLCHQKELIEQNSAELAQLWPQAPMGIYSAGMGQRDAHADMLFASIQSVWRYPQILGRRDLVLVDECHLINQSQSGMYRRLLEALKLHNERMREIGWTATAFRTGHGDITYGEEALFSATAHETTIRELLDGGFLAPLRSKQTTTDFDTSGIRIQRGEYVQREAQAAMDVHPLTEKALDEVQALASGRNTWLFFCAGVEHAKNVRDALIRRGITAATLTGQTPREEREDILAQFRAGELQAVTNASLMTTGVNIPNIDLIVMLAPTASPGRFVQIGGRGMRNAPGKRDCLFLDFAGVIEQHGPIDQVRPWRPRERRRGAPVIKACPECAEIVAVQTRECPECGYAFPFEEHGPRHEETATDAPILSVDVPPVVQRVEVTAVSYHKHVKRGAPGSVPSLRVEYHAGLLRYKEWVTIEHGGAAGRRAREWWERRWCPDETRGMYRGMYRPPSIEAAITVSDLLVTPTHIDIDTSGRFPQVVGYVFADETEEVAA